ncbi:uncharacterized protein LAJ45_03536 [Morchella importuna]|uniref:uncharacterized protein n=1 Tax=Morchella importuna TaxID=1174673 RepID=UPI001E8D9181|nr:uncharacterized protein LAJ45_03536 [Morchella importuna]KAH8152694.1 hypothetical protein LAJ45_03536 [Morchella importuna]
MTNSHSVYAYAADRTIDYEEWINPTLIEKRFSAAAIQYSRGFEVIKKPEEKREDVSEEALPLVATIYTFISGYPGLADTIFYKNLIISIENFVKKVKGHIIKLRRQLFPPHSPQVDIVYIYSATGNLNHQPLIESVHHQPKFGRVVKAWFRGAMNHRKVYLGRKKEQMERMAVSAVTIGDRFIRRFINVN